MNLTLWLGSNISRRMFGFRFLTRVFGISAASLAVLLTAASGLAATFSTATVTKVEKRVLLGDREGSVTRAAVENDVMQARNFLRSENASRAELQYPDGTVVRVGQNTVFTFDAGSRTLTLDHGSLLFHIPKNSGGGTIKTASLTAAITGTAGKVSDNVIAIVEGEIKLVPGGQVVRAGEFARRNADGSITVAAFNPDTVLDGKLVYFNGLMPGFPDASAKHSDPIPQQLLRDLEVQFRTQNLPGSINFYFPIHEHSKPRQGNSNQNNSPSPPPSTPPSQVPAPPLE